MCIDFKHRFEMRFDTLYIENTDYHLTAIMRDVQSQLLLLERKIVVKYSS